MKYRTLKTSTFYYDRLSDKEKKLYSPIRDGLYRMEEKISIPNIGN